MSDSESENELTFEKLDTPTRTKRRLLKRHISDSSIDSLSSEESAYHICEGYDSITLKPFSKDEQHFTWRAKTKSHDQNTHCYSLRTLIKSSLILGSVHIDNFVFKQPRKSYLKICLN